MNNRMIERAYVDTAEGRMHYLTAGSGHPLLLLHQNPRSSRMYEELIPFLIGGFRVIAPDMPGTGSSGPAQPDFRIEDLGRCTLHLLDALDVRRCHIFGLHTGALIGSEIAAEWPDRVASLMCYGYAATEPGAEREAAAKEYVARAASLVEPSSDGTHLMRQWHSGYRQITHMWWNTGTLPTRDLSPELARFQQRYLLDLAQARDSAAAMYKAVFRYDWQRQIPRVQARTLFVEVTSPYEPDFCHRGDTLSKLVRNGAVTTLERADANGAEFAPKDLADVIIGFLGKDGE